MSVGYTLRNPKYIWYEIFVQKKKIRNLMKNLRIRFVIIVEKIFVENNMAGTFLIIPNGIVHVTYTSQLQLYFPPVYIM